MAGTHTSDNESGMTYYAPTMWIKAQILGFKPFRGAHVVRLMGPRQLVQKRQIESQPREELTKVQYKDDFGASAFVFESFMM